MVVTAACAALLVLVGPSAASAAGTPGEAVWPLLPRPEVVAGFDPPARNWDAGHRGVDLRGAPGQPVRAAEAGRIIYAGRLAGRGIVVVSHGATRTTYQPVRSLVRVGAVVRAGQRVGVLEAAGSHCWPGTCLHWGLIRGETYLNPLTLVGAGPVRLLPFYAVLDAFGLGQGHSHPSSLAGPLFSEPLSPPSRRAATPGDVPVGRPGAVDPW